MSCYTTKFYAEQSYIVTKGNDFSDDFVLQDNDGQAIDITSYTISFYLRANEDDAVATLNAVVTKTDVANGVFNVRIDKTDIDDLTVNTPYFLYLEISFGATLITRLKGELTVKY